MPIISIPTQPVAGSLMAAYRPIVFKVEATATGGSSRPPFVICDVYVNEVYYRSLSRTAPQSIGANSSFFQFDISEVVQEVLQPDLAAIANNTLLAAPHMSARVLCRFRSSDKNAGGFTVEEGTRPVQATKFTAAVAGTGTASNAFFVINAALQHEDNQNLAAHLGAFKNGDWHAQAFPLTHRKRYFFCPDSSDHYPIVYSGPCAETDLVLHYRMRGSNEWQTAGGSTEACEAIDFETEVVGNRVNVHLTEPLPPGQRVQYRWKPDFTETWLQQPKFTTQQDFQIPILGLPGTYDIQVIRFCSCCTTAPPVEHQVVIEENAQNQFLAWRGRDPFCEQVELPAGIWVKFELRNPQSETRYYPNSQFYYQKTEAATAELYALFFSDAALLTPLNVQQEDLKIYVKRRETTSDGTRTWDVEGLEAKTVAASGTEMLLGTFDTSVVNTSYKVGDTEHPTGRQEKSISYQPYPTAKLIGGNTGRQGFATLQQYNTLFGTPTGQTKPNAADDPDYIAPGENAAACPSGAPFTNLSYGFRLEIAKVEFRQGGTFIYAPTVANTEGGGTNYFVYVPKDQDTYITVKARTLDSGNTTGKLKVSVQFDDNTTQVFEIPNNIETQLPGPFRAVAVVNISNY